RFALRLLRRTPLLGERSLRRNVLAAARLHSSARRCDLLANGRGIALRRGQCGTSLLCFGAELGTLRLELCRALAIPLVRLAELQLLDLGVVPRFFLACNLLARFFQRRFARKPLALRAR